MAKITRPVLRYPGGKYRLAKWIVSHFPAHGFYCEPFGGAASVLMQKPKSKGEIYNDLDGAVVNVFRVLRDKKQAKELERVIRLTPFAYEEYKNAHQPCDEPVEWARRTIFRSFAAIGSDGINRPNTGFRGLKNNESFLTCAHEWSRYPDAIAAFVERLQGVLIEQRDAMRLFKLYDKPETLFYVDPPYLGTTRSNQSVLYSTEMKGDDQHVKLAETLSKLQGMVVLSGYSSELYDDLFKGWTKTYRMARANIGYKRTECLYLSPNIQTLLFSME